MGDFYRKVTLLFGNTGHIHRGRSFGGSFRPGRLPDDVHEVRSFHDELGTGPARYVESVRLDAARAALEAGHSLTGAARQAGFGSPETLRRVFVARLGIPPSAYAQRFRSAQRPDAGVSSAAASTTSARPSSGPSGAAPARP